MTCPNLRGKSCLQSLPPYRLILMLTDARQHAFPSRHGSAPLLVIGILLAIILLVVGIGYMYMGGEDDATNGPLLHLVERGVFTHDVVEKGEVESSENVELRCEVKGRNSSGTAILEVVPEGTLVHTGDLIVKLDSSALEDQLIQQQISTNNKNALMIQSRNLFEASEIAKKEYIEGTYKQDVQAILSEIFVAEENVRRAQQYAQYSDRLAAKGYVTELQLEGDRFAVEKNDKELEVARTKLTVLTDFTREKIIKQLDADIKISHAKWEADKSTYALELHKLSDIQEQISKCEIRAPADGQVIHANRRSARGSNEFIVEAGAMVRERQAIIRLPNVEQMQITTKIYETQISLIRTGMPVTIVIDALEGETLVGEVTQVNEYPEPSSFYSSYIKQYLTKIEIRNPPDSIRSGLTAKVRIHVNHIEDALQVPVQAIYQHGADFYCFVRDGSAWNPQIVTLGSTNDKNVVIEEGLAVNDAVSLNPGKYLEMVSLPDLPDIPNGPRVPAGRRPHPDKPKQGPKSSAPGNTPAQIVATIFKSLDKNNDGNISIDEIPSERRERLTAADSNGDGNIDRSELTTALSQQMKGGAPDNSQRRPQGTGE
jgi:HlyD family secretion protein